MLSMIDPAAPSGATPAAARVAVSSLASRPLRRRLPAPKASSHVRDVMSTLLALQTTESAVTEIFRLGGNFHAVAIRVHGKAHQELSPAELLHIGHHRRIGHGFDTASGLVVLARNGPPFASDLVMRMVIHYTRFSRYSFCNSCLSAR